MKIECKIIRDGGSKVDLDGIEYHFEPLADGAHVAEIENIKHIDRFLSIGEGYRVYHGTLEPVGQPVKLSLPVVSDRSDLRNSENSTAKTLYGSSVHDASYDINGKTYSLGDVVQQAFAASRLSAEEWNDLEEEDRHAKIDIMLDAMAEQTEAAPAADLVLDERATLAAAYKAKFGKAPHYKASVDTLKTSLAE